MKDCFVFNFSNNWIRCLFIEDCNNIIILIFIFKCIKYFYKVVKGCFIKLGNGELIVGSLG